MILDERIADIIKTYQDKLIYQFNTEYNRDILGEFLSTLVDPVMIFDAQPYNAFNLNTAVGKQLDVIGERVVIDRFYSLGSLNDNDFRNLIKLKIIKNNTLNHSFGQISDFLFGFFNSDIIPFTENKMDINYIIKTSLETLAKVAIEKDILPRPSGVDLNYVIEIDNKIFAFASSVDNPFPGELPSFMAGLASSVDSPSQEGGQFLSIDNFIN